MTDIACIAYTARSAVAIFRRMASHAGTAPAAAPNAAATPTPCNKAGSGILKKGRTACRRGSKALVMWWLLIWG